MFVQLIDIVGVVMDRSHMKDTFTNSYGKILTMLTTEVEICKVRIFKIFITLRFVELN